MLPGGQTDKVGNRYEYWWTVQQVLRLICGDALSIRIEPPGIDKAEFALVTPRCTEYHQCKRSSDDGKWSLADLGSPKYKVLQEIYPLLAGNTNEFHLASGSDSPEVRELSERARLLETWEEFADFGLEAQKHRNNFETRLLPAWRNPTGADAYRALRRVFVHVTDEDQLRQSVTSELKSLYLAEIAEIREFLRGIIQDQVGHTLMRDELLETLKARGYFLRRITDTSSALPAVEAKTDEYVNGIRARLIGRTLIPRNAAGEVVARVTSGNGLITAITGKAGGGKSGCALQVVEMLRAAGVPVLAFRLDRIPPVTTAADLGVKMGLEESPALMLAAAAQGRPAVLVIDQLDAVSTISGRNAGFFEAIQSLLDEARGLGVHARIHVVVVCRKFDWENDHRLRSMAGKEDRVIEVADFTPAEVTTALRCAGFDSVLLTARQMTLLQVPQNLALFLESPSARINFAGVGAPKDLYDAYWKDKRAAVNERAKPEPDRWHDITETLTAAMTESQQLSVPHEWLDTFPPAYLEQMVSEGVLSSDGSRFAFGHESFFDYCYARSFVRAGKTLLSLLQSSEQHLFRRAQVRQVLAYLRDNPNKKAYCRELESLICSDTIRIHIKEIALSLVAAQPVVSEPEWDLLFPWVERHLAKIAAHGDNPDKLEQLVWRSFFGSQSWFNAACDRGEIAKWLASGNDHLINLILHYIQWKQRADGDAVAALLEPYADAGGLWPDRLRACMSWADHQNSRRFFELLLRLIDNGVLDNARSLASNGTIWTMLHGVCTVKPGWVPEVMDRWLRRRLALITEQARSGGSMDWSNLFDRDRSGSVYLRPAADQFPDKFVELLLPLFLDLSDAAAYQDDDLPRGDSLWDDFYPGEYISFSKSCQLAMCRALGILAERNSPRIAPIIEQLRTRDTRFANTLLVAIYTDGAAHFADGAVTDFCSQPWRFFCGYSDSPFWLARQMISRIVPHCSRASLTNLESAILAFETPREKTVRGLRWRGRSSSLLLCAIPEEFRSETARVRHAELERKFGPPNDRPQGFRSGQVVSPIKREDAEQMTDEHWLKALAKYDSEDRKPSWEDFLKGGAYELGGTLQTLTKQDPTRYGNLALKFPPGTNPTYYRNVLYGLAKSSAPTALQLDVCRKAFEADRVACAMAVVDLLGSIESALPDDCLNIITWTAMEHPDPEPRPADEGATENGNEKEPDYYTDGINCARGRAAEAMARLIWNQPEIIQRLRPAIDSVVRDQNTAVRSCAAFTLIAIAVHDPRLALALFDDLAGHGADLLATPRADDFIHRGLREHFGEMRPHIVTMLGSASAKAEEAGGRFAALAVLHGHEAGNLLAEALAGGPSQRLGVARVAASNFADDECRAQCEPLLVRFFNDNDSDVRRVAAGCFNQLAKAPLSDYEALIAAFSASRAFTENSYWILDVLEESPQRLPGLTLDVCRQFLERSGEGNNADVGTVAKLIFRIYQQHLDDEWASRCLDLIDRMLLDGVYDAGKGLEDFER